MYEDIKTACLYVRFSSHNQTEQSIEGQTRVCQEFCQRHNIKIVEIYADRATSASKNTEKRVSFLKMIKDSEKGLFDAVVVYKLDRFARSRYDSATYKYRLKKNGVQLISATENITNSPEGIILESVLEGMAEFYSAELSQKINRGMRESAYKHNSIGGALPLGYKTVDKKLVIDEKTAPIVREAFTMYAEGHSVAEICRIFNARGYKTSKGTEFGKNSFSKIFRNERYIGTYTYHDYRAEDAIPAIIDRDLWDRVQLRLKKVKNSPGRNKAKRVYLLSGKLFCGHCGESMNGNCNGNKYAFYECYGKKSKYNGCQKRNLRKEYIERLVAQDALSLLTDENIEHLATVACERNDYEIETGSPIPVIRDRIHQTEVSINNLTKAIETGATPDALVKRMVELEREKKDLSTQLKKEEELIVPLEKEQVIFWLEKFKDGDIEDEEFCRLLIDLFVNSVTAWDEDDDMLKVTIAYNLTSLPTKTYRLTKDGTLSDFTGNAPGIVSRNNSTLNNKTDYAGMRAYYALLSQQEGADSLSQFNHPGNTFGTFGDFAFWDPVIDSRMYMVEAGNGEGQIGAGGYYPSYEYYTMALDKGWHLAPTNNQDNHKGRWGNANDARDVILTDDFSEEGIYDALRAMRMYATEDKNLEIGYTVNGMLLGSSLTEVPEKLNIHVTVNDPDASDSISKVEVIVNSGKTAYTWDDPAVLATGDLSVTLDPDYSYYYIRVTQGDGDLAVTAPVWVGETLKLGISDVTCGTSTPVTGEKMTVTTTLFNSESTDANIKSITYAVGSQVLASATDVGTVPASGTLALSYDVSFDTARVYKVTATVVLEQDGKEYVFTKDITLDVLNADDLVYIGIDASHYNEYVAGNYKDSMGNFGNLAGKYNVRTVELKTSDDLIAACSNPKFKALILTAPSRRLADAQTDPRTYSAQELAAIAAFNAGGGTVILAGWSDNYENYDVIQNNPAIKHMAATQNEVLQALGSSLRISDDATYDDVRSAADGVDKWRLYFNTYGQSFLTDGVEVDPAHPYDRLYTEVFSHYGGLRVCRGRRWQAHLHPARHRFPGGIRPQHHLFRGRG